MSKLILILGDQLSFDISSLRKIDKSQDYILMAEVLEEASYVRHHKHKIILIFSAMRHFADELTKQGYQVIYSKFDDPKNFQSLAKEADRICQEMSLKEVTLTYPNEYRLLKSLESLSQKYSLNFIEDDRFYCTIDEFKNWAKGKKQLILEYFYRYLRKKHNILMKNDQPIGGRWNFDGDNRKPLKGEVKVNKNLIFQPDKITQEIIDLVAKNFPDNMGFADNFNYAVNREGALMALNYFLDKNLVNYGTYQDAMVEGEDFLFHSIISPYINIGLINPREICLKAEQYYLNGLAPINAVEGFIRQILGWREYIRGIYWLKMPEYTTKNFLNANNKLPSFFWSGETDLNCLKNVVGSTIKNAYSHHIQRLMITGNFAILIGANIAEIHEWYLAVYIDAFEWVEAPNTIGMSQYGDGGIVATKPYISGGSYINRMSNFCKNCRYNVKTNDQNDSCPFNYLYWNFLNQHQDKFGKNPRMAIAYKNLEKMDQKKLQDIVARSKNFIKNICQ